MTTTVYRPATSFTGDSSITGDLTVTGDVAVNTDDFFVDETSGNSGFGINSLAPFGTDFDAIQVGATGVITENSDIILVIGENFYNDNSNWRYITASHASAYTQQGATHLFQVAASGSVGSIISWTNAVRIESDGVLNILLDTLRITTQKTPATAGATGVKGDIVHDTGFIYVCTATDTWKRVAIATW